MTRPTQYSQLPGYVVENTPKSKSHFQTYWPVYVIALALALAFILVWVLPCWQYRPETSAAMRAAGFILWTWRAA